MRNETFRSLLLVDADPAERRLVSAIAARAGWSVVGAADGETANGLLQGPHGREVRAALLTSWNAEAGPELIAALRPPPAATSVRRRIGSMRCSR